MRTSERTHVELDAVPEPLGLRTTTVVRRAALLLAGIAGYAAAPTAGSQLVQSQSADIAFSVRHDLVHAGSTDPATLQAILADLADLGMRSIAVLDPDGSVVAFAGEPQERSGDGGRRTGAPLDSRWVRDRVR